MPCTPYEKPASDGKAEVDQWLSLRYMRPHQYAQAQRGFPRKNSRRCLTGNHRAARAGKTQKVRQGDEGDDEFDLILATLCAQSFFTVKGEVFKSEEGDTVSDSLWFNDSEGTAAISAAWYMRRERLKTSLLAQLQELVKMACQLMKRGVDCRSAVDNAMMAIKKKYQASTLLNLPSACFIHGPAEFELAPMDFSRARLPVSNEEWNICLRYLSDIDLYIYGPDAKVANEKSNTSRNSDKANFPAKSPFLIVSNSRTIAFHSADKSLDRSQIAGTIMFSTALIYRHYLATRGHKQKYWPMKTNSTITSFASGTTYADSSARSLRDFNDDPDEYFEELLRLLDLAITRLRE
ncbi:hypothetical protein ARMGADRAFT_1029712 [Armillaria gallica]|uniref:Uncharacterized protein n=1 Tax=Armillaria gallica TaxID=47427 RepID=A0A2H3DF30_ARMGA|nr:hypothetical protein ARMGADRAFT_1029712 [Armillaria gallica]